MSEDKIIDIVIKKVDGVADDVRSNSYTIDRFEAKFDVFQVKFEERFGLLGTEISTAVNDLADTVNTMSKQFGAVTSKVIEQDRRLDSVESRLAVVEAH